MFQSSIAFWLLNCYNLGNMPNNVSLLTQIKALFGKNAKFYGGTKRK